MTAADQSERMDDLAARLASVELELAMVRASVEQHLRTRRLAVVDEHGVERIVLDARHGTGSVLVRVHGPDGRTTVPLPSASTVRDGTFSNSKVTAATSRANAATAARSS